MEPEPSHLQALVDNFQRQHDYLRISVTERCNLRCRYCMPPEGIALTPRRELLSYEEIETLTQIFARLGVKKLRLTGGEPLVRRDLPLLVEKLARIPGIETLAMTSNGVRYAEHARQLRDAGLTHLNLSLDTLRPKRFERIALRRGFEKTMRSIDAALALGYRPLKLNVVVMGGVNDDELCDFVEFVRERPINVRFIEFMPFAGNRWQRASLVNYRAMLDRLSMRYTLVPDFWQGEASTVARDYRLEGFAGSVSFITSMSEPFCASCNRLRLTADGMLKPCLHDAREVNLRDPLRQGASEETLVHLIREGLAHKAAAHGEAEALVTDARRAMIAIGG